MITTLKPYPKYKDSSVPWLGDVPEHWEVRRLKTLLRERIEKGYPDLPLLAATQTKGVVRKEKYENRTVLALKDLHLLKLVRRKDFVISLRSFQGGIEYARDQGIISPAYTILYPIDSKMHGYLAKLFKSYPYIENLKLHVTGIRQGQNIDYEKLSRSLAPLPPLPEQTAIVRFLDWADRRIRRVIRLRNQRIKLLEEYKQALTHQAVTGKIDVRTCLTGRQAGKPYPKYKNSLSAVPAQAGGVEWLGEVPEHWEVRRLKSSVAHINEQTNAKNPDELYVALEHVESWTGRLRAPAGDVEFDSQVKRFRAGDVLFGKLRPYLAKVVRPEQDGVCVGEFIVLRPKYAVTPRYLEVVLRSSPAIDFVNSSTYGAKMPRADWTFVGSMIFPHPPITEQTAIVEFLDEQTERIDAAIAADRRVIDLLKEFRTRLVADVVTGKLDVRDLPAAHGTAQAGAAAKLPDEPPGEEATPLDEEEPAEDNEGSGEISLETVSEETEI